MKIVYGVQATGNGHISRARAMNRQFQQLGVEVDFVFSGRQPRDYFDMEEFAKKRYLPGLTLFHSQGRVDISQTVRQNSVRRLIKDIKDLDLSAYDLVISDFEPITAWAAKQQNKTCLGLGHQYVFSAPVPKHGETWITRFLMSFFAPCRHELGMHWHHFNSAILPPIAEIPTAVSPRDHNQYLVYLAFEDQADIVELLEGFEQHTFICYGAYQHFEKIGNIQFKVASSEGFKRDLASSAGVICNAGFELPSEALQLGVKLLVKPLLGQFEQESNARALEELGLGMTMNRLDRPKLAYWLNHFAARQIIFPDVANAVARWILAGQWDTKNALIEQLWRQVNYIQAPGLATGKSLHLPTEKAQVWSNTHVANSRA